MSDLRTAVSNLRTTVRSDSQRRDTSDAHRLLGIYLRDHQGGARGGLSLVRRLRRAEDDPLSAAALAGIEAQIADEREALKMIMTQLGVSGSRVKQILGLVASALGRLKSNGRLVRPSPSSRVVELEGLGAGIVTKRSLWLSLLVVADTYSLDQALLHSLVEQATAQHETLRPIHDRAAAAAFM